jgi:chemotaxis receptor (MCP) glutamine deamidase CheD
VSCQYLAKRATLDKSNIEKQVTKAMKVISGQIQTTITKFLNVGAKKKQLNQKLIDKA